LFIYFTILLKLGGAPLHFWAPDLYASQPSNVTQWLLIVPKLGNLLLLLNLYSLFNNTISNPSIDNAFTQLGSEFIMVVGILSM
jgi:NADH:ubiquinone oxidoreductase subunit 2 (subunit N)